MSVQSRSIAKSLLVASATVAALSTGCSAKGPASMGASAVAGTTFVNGNSEDLFNGLTRPVINGSAVTRGSLATITGRMNFNQFYEQMLAGANNNTVTIDGVVVAQNAREKLVGSRQAILALGERFANLSEYWSASGVNPSAVTLVQFKTGLLGAARSAGLSLTGPSQADDVTVSGGSSQKCTRESNSFMAQCLTLDPVKYPFVTEICKNPLALTTTTVSVTVANSASETDVVATGTSPATPDTTTPDTTTPAKTTGEKKTPAPATPSAAGPTPGAAVAALCTP